jgi:hypothetical protein
MRHKRTGKCGGIRAESAGLRPDELQAAGIAVGFEAGDSELLASMGEVDGGGGEGGASGVDAAGAFGAGGESFGAAEQVVCPDGGGDAAEARDSAEKRRG